MKRSYSLLSASNVFAVSIVAMVAACSSSKGDNGFDDPGSDSDGGATTSRSDGGGAVGNGDSGIGNIGGNVGDGGNMMGGCQPDPGNYDIPGNNCDDDGDGMVDNVIACDSSLAATGDAMAFAQAMGLCQQASGNKWGVVSASFAKKYNSTGGQNDQQHGILPKFGNVVVPREGKSLGVLSSGTATETDGDMGPAFKGGKKGMSGAGSAPPGYPKPAAGCPGANGVEDMIVATITIKVPNNAQGLQFDFDFWSGEWPEYDCTEFNDSFVAFLKSAAFNGGNPDNISFDTNNNPVSVNNNFFEVCTDKTTTGCAPFSGGTQKTSACPLGTGDLAGTGFNDPGDWCTNGQTSSGGGATGWLTTKAPVKAGETITVQFMIWDTGDANYDSSVLLDNFQWQPGPTMTGTGRPPPK